MESNAPLTSLVTVGIGCLVCFCFNEVQNFQVEEHFMALLGVVVSKNNLIDE